MDEFYLTESESGTLAFIEEFSRTHRYAPTIREIMEGMQITSPASVERILVELEERGYIRREKNRARTIQVVGGDRP